ncbi:MAG: hypothetical protein ACRDT6_22270, partial [Micromonosporaceae bacterium]
MVIAEPQPHASLVPGGFPPDDEVQRDLLQARALIEAAMFKQRRQTAVGSMVELSREEAASRVTVSRLLASAREALVWVVPRGRLHAAALPGLGRSATRGAQVRLL